PPNLILRTQRPLNRQRLINIILNQVRELTELHLLQLFPCLNRAHHDLPNNLVRFTERHSLSHEIVCELRRIHVTTRRCRSRSLFINSDIPQHRSRYTQTRRGRIERIKHRLLVFLHVFVVCERQSLQRCERRHQIAKHTPSLAAHELHRVRILLLRHQARTRRDRITELEKPELARRVKNDVFSKSRQVDHDQRTRAQKLHREIPIAHGVETVARNSFEAKRRCQCFAINWKRCARQRRRAERHHVYTSTHLREALSIAFKHLDVGEAPVSQQDRLRTLQVRVSGNDDLAIRFGKVEQSGLGVANGFIELVNRSAQPESKVSSDLIVAATSGVQLATDVAGKRNQSGFDE